MTLSALPRMTHDKVSETMFLRPRDPSDHRDFQMVLPLMSPLFLYDDEDGKTWLRWSVPMDVAVRFGFNGGCACCGGRKSTDGAHSITLDTLLSEVEWFFDDQEETK